MDRWNFLLEKSKRLTVKERRFGVQIEMFKGTEPRGEAVKRKLSLDPKEEPPRPAKVPRIYLVFPS